MRRVQGPEVCARAAGPCAGRAQGGTVQHILLVLLLMLPAVPGLCVEVARVRDGDAGFCCRGTVCGVTRSERQANGQRKGFLPRA